MYTERHNEANNETLTRLMDTTPEHLDRASIQRALQLSNAIAQLQLVRHTMLQNPDRTMDVCKYDPTDCMPSGSIRITRGLGLELHDFDPSEDLANFTLEESRKTARPYHSVYVSNGIVQSIHDYRWGGINNREVNFPHDLLAEENTFEIRAVSRKADAGYLFAINHLLR